MSRITVDHLAAAIRKVRSMSLKEKAALAVEFLLHILLVCYQSMKESGLQWPVITEDEQERQMQRWIGAVQFSEHAMGSVADAAREQYISQHSEQPLLAFIVSEMGQWLGAISVRNAEAES